ncbi:MULTISPECIES: helix-turn-helix domain-containing protein [unclassified Streptomyces]|uniref:helix-turn-helix domain-containing protein n=1 Tax=unclassified Streptomyces TaxID=2593676 RepID=UPI00380FFF92
MNEWQAATATLCRLQLGSELRRIRTDAGLTSTQVVRRLLWSPSKLTRLETGDNVTVEPSDIMALCQVYKVDEETAEQLKEYAFVTKKKQDWWEAKKYRSVIGPGPKALLGLESSATALQSYNSEYVPGLLQTAEYVRVLHQHAHGGRSGTDIDRMVELRMKRQAVLHRDPPLKLTVVLNESVLLRQVGGSEVMRPQLARIVEAASAPNVKVQVIPFASGVYRAMNGSFTSLRFRGDTALKPIVCLEHLADHWVLRRQADVELYEEAFNELQALAPGPRESLSMIERAMEEL